MNQLFEVNLETFFRVLKKTFKRKKEEESSDHTWLSFKDKEFNMLRRQSSTFSEWNSILPT